MPSPARRIAAIALALVVLGGLAGCRALTGRTLGRPEAIAARPAVPVSEVVMRHNQNAGLVNGLEDTNTTVSMRSTLGLPGAVEGLLALERPKNFRMVLGMSVGGDEVADIGSNDGEYWMWTKAPRRAEERAIYVGQYDESGELPPELLIQPDWLIEALGLYVIPPEEAEGITTERGKDTKSVTLVHHRVNARGERMIKKTVIDATTGETQQHQFFAPDGKTMVAVAYPSAVQSVNLPETAGGTQTVRLPFRIRVVATPPGSERPNDRVELTVKLDDPRVNPEFNDRKREKLFAPPIAEKRAQGYAVVDISQPADAPRQGRRSTRNSMPAPPAGFDIQLDAPEPIHTRGGAGTEPRSDSEPLPLSPDLPAGEAPPSGIDAVIRPPLPSPPGQDNLAPAGDPYGVAFGPTRGAR